MKEGKTKKPGLKTSLQDIFAVTLGNEKWQSVSIPAFAILLSLITASVVILMLGKNPLSAFLNLLQGSGIAQKPSYAGHKSMLTDFMSLLDCMTPMLFAALAVAVALKAGLFNIGVSGQMLAAGFVSTVLVGYSSMSGIAARPLVLLIGLITGAAVGVLIGALKHWFNINEVVTSIMLNYIIMYVVSFFINNHYIDPVSRQSKNIVNTSRLTLADVKAGDLVMNIPLGIVLAVVMAFVIKFFLDRTRFGYEMKTVGTNKDAAKYAGIDVGKNIILAMLISGALAGLAGVTYYMGYYTSIKPRVLASVGFDAIAVSLLGNSNPIGIIFSSFLITIIDKGSTYMSSMQGIRREIASVITGLILLFNACGMYIKYIAERSKRNIEDKTAKPAVGEVKTQ